MSVAYAVRPTAHALDLLGMWVANENCVPGAYHDERVAHRVTARRTAAGLAFAATQQALRCYYPPASPRP